MNWVKELNDTEKEFYNKCADITMTSTYLMEEAVKESIGIYQVLLMKFTQDDNMTVEDIAKEFDKCFGIMKYLYKTSAERLILFLTILKFCTLLLLNILLSSSMYKLYNTLNLSTLVLYKNSIILKHLSNSLVTSSTVIFSSLVKFINKT
jgi:hypothetical protein